MTAVICLMTLYTALGGYQGEKLEKARPEWMFHDAIFNCMIRCSLHPNLCTCIFLFLVWGGAASRMNQGRCLLSEGFLGICGRQKVHENETAECCRRWRSLWVKMLSDEWLIYPKLLLLIPDIWTLFWGFWETPVACDLKKAWAVPETNGEGHNEHRKWCMVLRIRRSQKWPKTERDI